MNGLAIAQRTIDFSPHGGIGSQVLIEAAKMMVKPALLESGFFGEYWSSERWAEGNHYFRVGLMDGRRDERGHPLDPSHDIMILPADGKETEWFTTNQRITRVQVRSRQCADDLSMPLRDITTDELALTIIVSIVARVLGDSVESIVSGTVVAG